MRKETIKLNVKAINAENELRSSLKKLPNWGIECDHEITDYAELIDDRGEYPEVIKVCLKCGGWLNP